MANLATLLWKNWKLLKAYRQGSTDHLPAIEALSEQVVIASRGCHKDNTPWHVLHPLFEVLKNRHNGFYVELKQAIDEKSKAHNQDRRWKDLARKKQEIARKERTLLQMQQAKKRKMKRLRKQKKREKRQKGNEEKKRQLPPPKVFKSGPKSKTSGWVWFGLVCAVVHISISHH